MAEEQKWQEAVTNHVLCANNCGFFGSSTTLNLCSKCYKNHCLKEQQFSTAKIAVEQTLTSDHAPPCNLYQSKSESESESSSSAVVAVSVQPDRTVFETEKADLVVVNAAVKPSLQIRNRCGACNKRVGLTGFNCRCGMMFCGTHRYPEKHECSFDFKTMGKEAIARENPVVKAAKLDKI